MQGVGMASPSDIWSVCDYAPTAARLRPVSTLVAAELSRRTPSPATVVDIGSGHGEGVAELLSRGYSVTAIEPTTRIRTIGRGAHLGPHGLAPKGRQPG